MSQIDDEAALMGGRPDPRPAQRDEDPRARAAARAAELLEHGIMDADTTDKFYIDPASVPDGWSYEWKRRSVLNAEDPAYRVGLAQMGWEEVPASRHPQFMPEGWQGQAIERDGMVLMERPKEITDRVRKRDQRDALRPIQDMEAKLAGAAPGQFERVDGKGQSTVKLNRSYQAPMAIPE